MVALSWVRYIYQPTHLWNSHWDDQTIWDIIDELRTRNNDGVLAVSDQDKQMA